MNIDYIMRDYKIIEYSNVPSGKCLVCARRVVELLTKRNIRYRVIGLLTWFGLSDLTPANHYAIVAGINGKTIIIDPTAGQFAGWAPFYGTMDDWITGLGLFLPRRLIKGRKFITVSEAEIAMYSLIMGSPVDFNGIVIQDTLWHKKIMKNPSIFAAQEEKQIKASSFIPLRNIKKRNTMKLLKNR